MFIFWNKHKAIEYVFVFVRDLGQMSIVALLIWQVWLVRVEALIPGGLAPHPAPFLHTPRQSPLMASDWF